MLTHFYIAQVNHLQQKKTCQMLVSLMINIAFSLKMLLVSFFL